MPAHIEPNMSKVEAASILDDYITQYEARGYDDLLAFLSQPDSFEIVGPSGEVYQIEIEAVWDDRHKRILRVFIAIDGGGVLENSPITQCLLVTPP